MAFQASEFKDVSESSRASDIATKENPLLIDLILENVLKSCEWKILNVCRLVNKHWYERSFQLWLNKAPSIRFNGDEPYVYEFVEKVHENENPALPYENRGLRQYRNFSLSEIYENDADILDSFLTGCGQWVTSLEIGVIEFWDMDVMKAVLLCEFTPNLKKLQITSLEFDFDEMNDCIATSKEQDIANEEICAKAAPDAMTNLKCLSILYKKSHESACPQLPISWTDLFAHHPKLESFKLGECNASWNTELDRVLAAITKVRRQDSQNLSLTSMDFADLRNAYNPSQEKFSAALLPFFENTQLYLKSLSLDLGMETSLSELHNVLSFHSETLQRLTLRRTLPLENFQFPEMKSMEYLDLLHHPFESLCFLRGCRKLKCLVLKDNGEREMWYTLNNENREEIKSIVNSTSEQDMEGVLLPSLKKFTCNYKTNYSSNDVEKLHMWMPNITSLELKLSTESFRSVCKLYQGLEHLRIFNTPLEDECITGISDGQDGNAPIKNNITDLRDLKFLEIELNHKYNSGLSVTYQTQLTEKSVLHGFLQVPRLKRLSFSANTMTTTAIEALKMKIPDAKVFYNRLL